MKFWTWAEILARYRKELDLDDYDGLTDETELLSLTNDAIDEAESQILLLNEDYFLSKDDITLVNGTDEYAMPSNIYGNKIRSMIFHLSTDVYEVHRIRSWHQFLKYRLARVTTSNTDNYRYFVFNDTAGEPKILLTPPAYHDGAYIERWYIRNANRLASGSDVCDIPEFIQFILWSVKAIILAKDGHHTAAAAAEKAEMWKSHMISTLENAVEDNNNEIEADFSHYDESTGDVL